MKKIFIISGEASGDLHASNLVKELKHICSDDLLIEGWGGDLMSQQGVVIKKHYKELAFMGFSEVIKNIGTILKNFTLCKKQIAALQPDLIILVDYPGFNLRMAKWAKEKGFKIVYYISPQIWAWKEKRIHTIKKVVDKMIVILPFEKEFYSKWNYEVDYVGHPLIKVVDDFKKANTNGEAKENLIALLPGSRKQEILKKLPIMIAMADLFKDYQFVIAQAPGVEIELYEPFLKNKNVLIEKNNTYNILVRAKAALVTSGTATLETALFNVPQIVCYSGSKLSYWLAKKLVKIEYISLVNLIVQKPIVVELIQESFNVVELEKELRLLLTNEQRSKEIENGYAALRDLLEQGGNASLNAANIIKNFLTQETIKT